MYATGNEQIHRFHFDQLEAFGRQIVEIKVAVDVLNNSEALHNPRVRWRLLDENQCDLVN